LAKTTDDSLVFEVTGNGILYDNVVVPVAIAVEGKVAASAKVSGSPNAAIGNHYNQDQKQQSRHQFSGI